MKAENTSDFSSEKSAPQDFSPIFKNWAMDLKEDKEGYLNFLVHIQLLLLKDVSENNYSLQDRDKLEGCIMTFQGLIVNS